MFTHDEVMMPLALTVVIDNKVRDPELKEFQRQAKALFDLFALSPMSDDEIFDWFKSNESEIEDTVKGARKNTAILKALSRFKDEVHIENMYDAMITISVADKEYRREESDLIKSAASIWGYERPPIKVID